MSTLRTSMFRERLQELLQDLLSLLTGTRASKPRQELEQLATGIIDYGRMMKSHYAFSSVIVDTRELALRFRESRRTVQEALSLLHLQGRAEETDLNGYWKLQI